MQAQVDSLAGRVLRGAEARFLVGLSGIPGSGKTTLARCVTDAVNRQAGAEVCVCVGMDGFHYTRAQLDTMDDPAYAHARRGAAFTFDADAFVAFVERLHASGHPGALPTLHAPSFSHAEKDPVADGITILPSHKIVLVEGLYCNLSVAPWDRAAACWDLRWLLTIAEAEARARLTRRHVEAGLAPTPDAARHRGTSHDLPSGYQ